MNRRQFLISTGVLALATPVFARAGEAPLTIVLPYPSGSFEALVRLLSGSVSRWLGRSVRIEFAAGDGGWEAVAKLQAGDPTSTVLADADLTLALKQEYGGRGFSISQLRPIAKITDGLSVALVARADGPYSSWRDLQQAAKTRTLRLASTGRLSAFGVAQRLLDRIVGIRFEEVSVAGPQASFDAVAQGTADLGLMTTALVQPFNATKPDAKIVPVLTFGAGRSQRYKDTPTLAEVVKDEKAAFTFALGIFGAAAMPAEDAQRLFTVLQKSESDADVVQAPTAADFPVHIQDGENLKEAFERDLRLVRRIDRMAG